MKRNILYISPDFNLACGVSKHVYTLLTSEELKKDFNLYFITNGGDAIFKLYKPGINYSIQSFKTDKIFHYDFFRNRKDLKNFCLEKNINLIHSHHRYPEFLANLIKKSVRLRTVVTVHNFVNNFKQLSYKSDQVIAISNAVSNHLINHYKVSSDRIQVLYNCIYYEKITARNREKIKEKHGIKQGKKILLYAGRFSEEKGTVILLDAFRLLFEYNKNILLLIIGGGKNSSNKIDMENIKIFPPQENLDDFHSVADLLILPSIKEGLGYTMLEAGLNKIPFIGSKTGGISEFIEDNVNGFLFEPGNSEDLARRIKFVLENPDAARISASRLNEKVLRFCNYQNYFQKLIDIYNKLLGAHDF